MVSYSGVELMTQPVDFNESEHRARLFKARYQVFSRRRRWRLYRHVSPCGRWGHGEA
jgi:N-acyl-L-homoserine lactone synthetase